MKNTLKQEIINDILTGLLVAATFATFAPVDVLAQNLAAVGTNSQTNVMDPVVKIVGYISYGLGTVMTVAGIAGAKKHADSPGNNPLTPALGKLGAGAAFLAAPSVANMLAGTTNAVGATGTSALQTFGQ